MTEHLLILGASARATAFSAARGGWRPWCGDLFGDVDLARRFPVSRVDEYPDGLSTLADAAPPGPWLYTGALENYPALIDRIAAGRRLYGNSGSVLRNARDPIRMAAALAAAGLAALPVAATSAGLAVDGSWLRKGLHSGGGNKVQAWNGQFDAEDDRGGAPRFYYQQRASGLDCSAVFLAAAGQAILLGVTRQLIATDWLRAKPFHYAGSLGPLKLDPPVESQWRSIGVALAAAFSLTGLFGVDAVLSDGVVWPVELNPRYPASAEVLERAMNFSAVGMHVEACRTGGLPPMALRGMALAGGERHGKGILFAQRDVIVSDDLVDTALAENGDAAWPLTADIPSPQSRIHAGAPVMTLFADAHDPDQLCDRLRRMAARYEGYLLPP